MQFRVQGTPQQQGSKTAFVIGKRAIMKDANEKLLKPWREKVGKAAEGAWGDKPLLLGPVGIVAIFCFERPRLHYGTGKNATVLKDIAPTYKQSTPDLDKLQRAIGDAVSGKVYKDDAQVVHWNASKIYGESAYADITIIDLSGGSHDDAGRTVHSLAGPHPGRQDPPPGVGVHRQS